MAYVVLLLLAVLHCAAAASECECPAWWWYKDTVYSGCQTTPDRSMPWCPVPNTCSVSRQVLNATHLALMCEPREHTAMLPECRCMSACNDDVPSCEVENPPCTYRSTAIPAPGAGLKAYMPCFPEACRRCKGPCEKSTLDDIYYCEIDASAGCKVAKGGKTLCEATDACVCPASWTYEGKGYSGCAASDASPTGGSWCPVHESCFDGLYADSTNRPGRKCNMNGGNRPCECATTTSCADGQVPSYCEVTNAPCYGIPSPPSGEKAYAMCLPEPCKCLDLWTWAGKAYQGCAAPFGKGWCKVADSCQQGIPHRDHDGTSFKFITECDRRARVGSGPPNSPNSPNSPNGGPPPGGKNPGTNEEAAPTAGSDDDDGMPTAVLIGIIVAVVVVLGVAVGVIIHQRSRSAQPNFWNEQNDSEMQAQFRAMEAQPPPNTAPTTAPNAAPNTVPNFRDGASIHAI